MTKDRIEMLAKAVFSETWLLLDDEIDLRTEIIGTAASNAEKAVRDALISWFEFDDEESK